MQLAKNWGVDITLLEANLERTPTKRLILHQRSLATAEILQEAWENARSKRDPQKAPAK